LICAAAWASSRSVLWRSRRGSCRRRANSTPRAHGRRGLAADCELWALTAGWRANGADNVVIRWEPGAAEGSAGFNFLEEVRLGTPHEVADAQNIRRCCAIRRGRGLADHWQKTSFVLLTGLILHVLYKKKKERGAAASLADVAYALSDPSRKSEEL